MSQLDNAYALIIGIGKDLPASVRDATAIYDILSDEELAGYNPENITLLTEKEATNTNILDAFDDLIKKVDEDSSVFLYYSGHGGTYTDNDIIDLEHPEGTPHKPEEENRSHYYLVPNNFDLKKYRETWVHSNDLKKKINQLKSRRLIFFFDCCHAEGMTKAGPEIKAKSDNLKQRLQDPEGLVHKMDDGKGYSIVSSCRADELSWILGDDPNSLFTTCLLEVLQGEVGLVSDRQYDVILANINKNVLLGDLKTYAGVLKENGILLLSGFYRKDLPDLQKNASDHGLHYQDCREREGWTAARFHKKSQ